MSTFSNYRDCKNGVLLEIFDIMLVKGLHRYYLLAFSQNSSHVRCSVCNNTSGALE